MTGNEYQKLAMRTNDGMSAKRLADTMVQTEEKCDLAGLLMGLLGLAGESGELTDLFKKWIFHGKELDEDHAKKELGDCCWYIADIAYSMGWELDEIIQMNVDKLKARYPDGFSTDLSNHRKEGDV